MRAMKPFTLVPDPLPVVRSRRYVSPTLREYFRVAWRCPRLDWHERQMLLQAARLWEFDHREMIHLGLLHALPVPFELFGKMRIAA